MSRTANIIIATIMWCAIAAYVVAASGYSRERRAAITVKEVRIAVVDTAEAKVVSAEKITRRLAEGGVNPIGQSIDSLDVRAIEDRIASLPEVRRADVWCDLEGTLRVRVEGRTPMMRVRSAGGYRFWLSDDGHIFPDRGDFGAYVPVVTGTIPFPFSTSTTGSYEALRRAEYDDYLVRFTEMEAERVRLSAELATTRSALRSTRAKGPKRFWGEARKERFAAEKAVLVAEYEAEASKLTSTLRSLASNKAALIEKEKKSYQSYLFLSKLANFVKFIERNDFWSAQIVQINVLGSVAGIGNANLWREPELELIPRAGDHTVLLGTLDGTEAERLEKLRLFYLGGLRHEGWDKFGYIDIKYKDQIVCK